MTDGLVYGLAAAAAWGTTDILAAVAARRIGGLVTAGLVQATSLAGLVAFSLATTGRIEAAAPDAPLAVAVGAVAAVSYLTFYVALRLGPVAVVSPVGSAYGAVAVILAVLLLGERPSPTQALGVVVVTAGVLAIGIVRDEPGRPVRLVGPGVPFVIVALLAWGLMTVGIATLVRDAPLLPVLLVVRVTAAAIVWGLLAGRAVVRRAGARGAPSAVGVAVADAVPGGAMARLARGGVGLALLAGLTDIAGYVAYATGLRDSLAWLVGLTSSFGPAVAFLFAIAFLGDRLRPLQWLGLGGLAGGLVLVGLP
ncbi:MAG: hypothetical protein RL338_1587 [Chloroflexota bacterium]